MDNKHKNQAIGVCNITGEPALVQWLPKEKKWECIHGPTKQADQELINDFIKKAKECRNESIRID